MDTPPIDNIEAIWQAHHDQLHAFISKRVNDSALADDLLQEVFIKVYRKQETLQTRQKVKSWLYQITRNTIIDHYRKQKPDIPLPAIVVAPQKDPAEKARQEIASCLVPMVENLPAIYRDAVMLSEIEGLTQKEVAEKLGLSVSGAKSRIQRGRALLKDTLLACCHFDFDHRGSMIGYESRHS